MANDIEYIEEWQRNNKEKVREYRLRYYYNNREKELKRMREYNKKYYKKKLQTDI